MKRVLISLLFFLLFSSSLFLPKMEEG